MKKHFDLRDLIPAELLKQSEKIDTPEAIQSFVSALRWNFEPKGDTCRGALETLRRGEAHCIEGAMVAALLFWLRNEPPLVMHFSATDDDFDHVIALFRRGGKWGAISKSNHAYLRYRDPVYRTPRELAVSYFHEYFDIHGQKSLLSFSRPFNLSDLGTEWITTTKNIWRVPEKLNEIRHYAIVSKTTAKTLRPLDAVERKAFAIAEHKKRRG